VTAELRRVNPMDRHAKRQVRRMAIGGVAALSLTAGMLTAGVSTAIAADPLDSATLVEVD